jgi:site-specific DNA recombinase
LNSKGLQMRGGEWRTQMVHKLLSSPTYKGEFCFNMLDSRTGLVRPESEWIRTRVDAIVSEDTWDSVRRKRTALDPRDDTPGKESPKNATSPVLLAGLIRCETCGRAMTQATGKSGRYRYYKCNHKLNLSPSACDTPNLPMERIDQLVLQRLVERVLTPERVTKLLREHMKRRQSAASEGKENLQKLTQLLKTKDEGLNNLYRAIEQGIVSLDSTLSARINTLKDEREEIQAELALVKRDQPSPFKVSPQRVAMAMDRLKSMLLDQNQGYGKQLLRFLVEDIQVKVGQMTLRGSVDRLEQVVDEIKMGTALTVPRFITDWRPHGDSNPGTHRERVMS